MSQNSKFKHGEIVFLITDEEQLERMVTAWTVRPSSIVYELSCGIQTTYHQEIEIVRELNVLLKLNKPRDLG